MKIFASSTMPHEGIFLHAGYVSSMPRPFDPSSYVDDEIHVKSTVKPLSLNVDKALQLAEQSRSAVNVAVAAPLPVGKHLSFNSLPVIALGVVLFLGFVWLLNYVKKYSYRLATAFLLISLLLTTSVIFHYSRNSYYADNSTLVSYAAHPGGPGPVRYKDPFSATAVIMHGLLADGVINSRGTITSLDQIRREVAFPTVKLTPGMKYALDNYAYDGWGRRFSLATRNGKNGNLRYRITSLGPDGILNTKDDIAIEFDGADPGNWDSLRWGLFAQRKGDNLLVFFHRWPGFLFEYRNELLAGQTSGSNIFDVWCSVGSDEYAMERIRKTEQWKTFATMKEGELFLWVPAWRMAGHDDSSED